MLVQQKQNIKGFTLLELLVVLAIIGAIAGVGFPNFSKWSLDRELRTQSEKIATMFTSATTQVERGGYPYVRLNVVTPSGDGTSAKITVKGITQRNLSDLINAGTKPSCSNSNFNSGTDIAEFTLNDKTKIFHLESGSVCFSKGGKYFKQEGKFDTQGNTGFENNKIASNNYVVTCHINSKKCDPVGKSFDEDFPVYLVKYSRFGMVSKYKWSFKKNDWISR